MDVLILGASGYGGGECLRLLAMHPRVASLAGSSRKHGGKSFASVHPHLEGVVEGSFQEHPDFAALASSPRPVVIAALPHGEFARLYSEYLAQWQALGLDQRLTVVDLSGDFRLDDPAAFAQAYGEPHPCPQHLGSFVYGLSEWQRGALRDTRRIANPGCFATALQLALLPLQRLGDKAPPWVAISAITGSSGSGASPSDTTHHPARAHDFRAYKVLSHQHEAEVRRSLRMQQCAVDFALVPHSAPLVRGIFATLCFQAPGLSAGELEQAYQSAYAGAPFIRLRSGTPRVAAVVGSNHADLAVALRGGAASVMIAIDNLVKGMAGQAIQNLNLAFGWPEDLGLRTAAVYP